MSGVHQSPAASAEPVSAWMTSDLRRARARPVVPVGEREGQARAAGLERERPEVDGS